MSKFNCSEFMDSVRRAVGEEKRMSTSLAEWRACLGKKGDDFVRHAYMVVLGRGVDAAGMADYAGKAESMAGKAKILCSLLLAPEKTYRNPFARKVVNALREGKKMLKKKGSIK